MTDTADLEAAWNRIPQGEQEGLAYFARTSAYSSRARDGFRTMCKHLDVDSNDMRHYVMEVINEPQPGDAPHAPVPRVD